MYTYTKYITHCWRCEMYCVVKNCSNYALGVFKCQQLKKVEYCECIRLQLSSFLQQTFQFYTAKLFFTKTLFGKLVIFWVLIKANNACGLVLEMSIAHINLLESLRFYFVAMNVTAMCYVLITGKFVTILVH